MTDFLKKIWGYVASFGIAIFAALFGIERLRRKNAERERDNAKAEARVSDIEKEGASAALGPMADTARKIQEIENEADDEQDYPSAVDDWNSHRV